MSKVSQENYRSTLTKRYSPGTIFLIDRSASVQFTEPFMFRLIRFLDWETYYGWVWIEGYELASNGDAIEKRTLFVQVKGLRVFVPKKRI